MKKAVCAVLLTAVFIAAAFVPGAAAEKKGVCLCFIVDNGSVAGCAAGASLFDSVLKAVVGSGEKVAFFFDCENPRYDADFASAMMKAFSAGMPVGIFDAKGGDPDRIAEVLTYEKYITRTTSRMILASSTSRDKFDDGFAVYMADIIISTPSLISAETLANFRNATMVARIDGTLTAPIIALFSSIKTSGIYIITPTETGFSAYGTED